MSVADSSELFSDYHENLPSFDPVDDDAPASPGLVVAQQIQQSTTTVTNRAPAKKPPYFELPITGGDDADNAFPFQLGTNASLAKTCRRPANLVNEAKERRSVSFSAGCVNTAFLMYLLTIAQPADPRPRDSECESLRRHCISLAQTVPGSKRRTGSA